jgi:hypothetical protein
LLPSEREKVNIMTAKYKELISRFINGQNSKTITCHRLKTIQVKFVAPSLRYLTGCSPMLMNTLRIPNSVNGPEA